MSRFTIGERIGFLYESGEAIIINIFKNNTLLIKDDIGFEQIREEKELIKIYGTDYKLENTSVPIEKQQIKRKNNSKSLINNKQQNSFWEIDLHVDRLLNSYSSLSNTEILLKQFHQFKDFLQRAKNKRVQKVVAIHGVGEGVLKNEIRGYLAKQENLEFYDASYLEYGKGATEIRIWYTK